MVRVSVPESMIGDATRVARLENDILNAATGIPGVTAVAFASSMPIEGFNSNDPVVADDKAYTPGQLAPIRRFKFVSPGYFRTVGTSLVVGRDFTWIATWRVR